MWTSWWLWPLVAVCTADQFRDEAERIMRGTPVIDGHNDLPWQLLTSFNNQLLAPGANLTTLAHTHTNIPKLKAGLVGGQVRQWPLPLSVSGSALPPQVLAKVRPLPGGSMSPSPVGPRVLGGVSDRPPGCGDGFEAGRGAGHTRPRAGGGPGA